MKNTMQLQFTLDGTEINIDEIDIAYPVVSLLREQCSLQSVRTGCSPQGSCGSCMIMIQGKPRLSCSLRAKNIDKKEITSLASIPPDLHRAIESSFLAHGITQCGYCLPAIIRQVATLLDKSAHPTDEEINLALQMHTCRCVGANVFREAIHDLHRTMISNIAKTPEALAFLQGTRNRVEDIQLSNTHTINMLCAPAQHQQYTYTLPIDFPEDVLCMDAQTLAKENPAVWFPSDLLAFLVFPPSYNKHNAQQMIANIVVSLCDTTEQKTTDTSPIPCNTLGDTEHIDTTKKIEFSFWISGQDPGYLETEACIITSREIITNGIPAHILHSKYPSHAVHTLPTGGTFDNRNFHEYVDWAMCVHQKTGNAVRLALSMADSLRWRSKHPPTSGNWTVAFDTHGRVQHIYANTHIAEGIHPSKIPPLEQYIQLHKHNGYTIPTLVDTHFSILSSKSTADMLHYHPVARHANHAYTVGMEYAMDRIAQAIQTDGFSVRLQNMSLENRAWMEKFYPIYNDILQRYNTYPTTDTEYYGIGIAQCHSGNYIQHAEIHTSLSIHIVHLDEIHIYGPYVESDGSIGYDLCALASNALNIPIEYIHYTCDMLEQSNFHDSDGQRVLAIPCMQKLLQNIAQEISPRDISALVGQRFQHTHTQQKSNIPNNRALSMVVVNNTGDIVELHLAIDIGFVVSLQHSLVQLSAMVQSALGYEGLTFQQNGEFSQQYRELHHTKPKKMPKIHWHLTRSTAPLTWPVMSAVLASINNARYNLRLPHNHIPFSNKKHDTTVG